MSGGGPQGCLLAVSGDVGGARAVMAVLEELDRRKFPFKILKYGYLEKVAPASWSRVDADSCFKSSLGEQFSVLFFSTSVADVMALDIAVAAKEAGLKTVCLLDSWMSYRRRLTVNGREDFFPDLYMVMDDIAAKCAQQEGIPREILSVVGQPALAELQREYDYYSFGHKEEVLSRMGLDPLKKLLIFISEPAESDQGCSEASSQYRGYTEKTVLKEFCTRLQPYADEYQLAVLPHPREDKEEMETLWQSVRGRLSGCILQLPNSRQAVFLCDGAAGMLSVLLYEAWAIRRPVISLQPGLRREELDIWRHREGVHRINESRDWEQGLDTWIREAGRAATAKSVRPDLRQHTLAPGVIAERLIFESKRRQL